MREHASKWIILALLVLIVGLPYVLRPSANTDAAASSTSGGGGTSGGGDTLIIYTPHNDSIRFEMDRGFNRWRREQGMSPVTFDWRAGGTSDIRKQVLDQFSVLVDDHREDQGIGIDLFFGGGEYDHDILAKGIKRGDEFVPLTIPAEISPELFKEVFPYPNIGGERLNHEQQRWTGVVLASFGIVYNRPYLEAIGVPEPTTWSDLTNPKLFGGIALADPAHSGSITAAYHAVMRRTGWTEGWMMLRRIFANSRYFTAGSTQVPIDVSAGEAAAGMCIDYYGRYQAGSVGHDRVGYVDPLYMTTTTADTLSIFRGAPHMEIAQQFVRWMLSKPAQRLWQLKLGTPGGPEKYELRRQPIRADLYTPEEKVNWTDPQIDPFKTSKPLPDGMPSFFNTIAPISHALAIDIHQDLADAWRAIIHTEDPARRQQMEAIFDQMPPELTLIWPEGLEAEWQVALGDINHPRHAEAAKTLKDFVDGLSARWRSNPDQRDKDRLAWTLFFRDQYRQVVAMGER